MNSLQKAILVFVIGASVVVALWAFPRYERWRGNTLTTTDVGYDQMQAVRQAYYNETTRLAFTAEVVILTISGVAWFVFQPMNQRR